MKYLTIRQLMPVLCAICILSGYSSAQMPLPHHDSSTVGSAERDFRNFEEEFRAFSFDMLRLNDHVMETIFSKRVKILRPYSSLPGEHEQQSGFRYNRVDGLFIGLGSQQRYEIEDGFYTSFGLGYAFGSQMVQAFGSVDFDLVKTGGYTARLGLEAHRLTDTREAWKIPTLENTLHALLAREDYRRYFFRTGWSGRLEQIIQPLRLSLGAEFRQDYVEPIAKNVNWSLFGGEKVFRDNPHFEKGWINSVIFSAQFESMGPRNPSSVAENGVFVVDYDELWSETRRRSGIRVHAQSEIGRRDYIFERYTAEVAWYQPITGIISLHTRLRAASLRGIAPAPYDFALGGVGSLPGFSWNEYTGNRMILFNSELIFSRFLSARELGLSLIVFADAGAIASAAPDAVWNEKLVPTNLSDVKLSFGIALGSKNGNFRIGAAWRTDRSEAPNLVLRLSPLW